MIVGQKRDILSTTGLKESVSIFNKTYFSVKKVSMFSPSAKAGLGVGDTLVTINDWNIEAMDNIQVHDQCRYYRYIR